MLTTTSNKPTASGIYFLAFNIGGGGNSTVTQAGWISTGDIIGSTTSSTAYYTLAQAAITVTKNPSVSSTATLTQTGVTLSTTDNGISIKATGSATASGSITATVNTAGYAPQDLTTTASISANSTTSTTKYITGVTLPNNKNTTFTVSASSNTRGNVTLYGYLSNTATQTISATVITSGRWVQQTITPTTANQGPYYGAIIVEGSTNLDASKIKSGVTIFGITGTFTNTSTVSSGQTAATPAQIITGYSAWVQGNEVKGNIASQTSLY